MFFLLMLIFTILFAAIQFLVFKRKNRFEKRVEKYLPRQGERNEQVKHQNTGKKSPKNAFKGFIIKISKLFVGKKVALKWKQKLDQANVPIKPEEFIAYRFTFCIIGLLLGFIFQQFLFAFLLVFVGFLLPAAYVDRRIRVRLVLSEKQLPQALGTMSSAMKSGFSFIQAMQLVGKEIPDPLGTEFMRTIRQINLGVTMEDAFKQLLDRLPNQDMELMVNAILIQRTTGGNLTDILEVMQETLRERVRFREELKALTAQGKMSAIVISLLPLGIAFLLNLMDPTYFLPMFQHPLGLVLLIAGVFSGIMGWVMIQKIVKIEV
ncbi:type II secretion system F family protein [Evansella sp. AB-P1]|uniref:type II secretion system F family protein n=1 Tax=Evansella sp. AB-P1 TaxID=3037653 RepID=UPI00241E1588|nr:type II secretion system F family protein [Evansella sp. AB-P1]MDG5788467.1 type II secretion system F family protein [Evansella sp. AB-P1]